MREALLRRTLCGLAVALLTATATTLGVIPATAHGPAERDEERAATQSAQREAKREQFRSGLRVPVVSSPNVRFVTNVPDTLGISGVFAVSAPYFYVSSLDSISVFDVSNPLAPRLTGVLDNITFENEAMNYGERLSGGRIERFVLVGVDMHQVSSSDPSHVNPGRGQELVIIDVTDPARPRVRSRLPGVTTSTHTVSCIRQTDCRYAYSAGDEGAFSILDLSNPDAPRELDSNPATSQVDPFPSPAAGPNPKFPGGAGHKWNFDGAGYGLHTGSGGTAIFDAGDPTAPGLVGTTDENGTRTPWNDFIHHNSDRPNAAAFQAGTPPDVTAGNVLLITEEDYQNPNCATAGSFQTWHVQRLDGRPGAVRPLDRINPVSAGEGVSLPVMAYCSAHWFEYHDSGIVAQAYYQGGLRLLDVRDARNIVEYGHFATGVTETWDAYWVPVRNSTGVATGRKSNVVYVVDLVRGLDVLQVDLPTSP